MEQYIPISGLLVFLISSLVVINKELSKRITFKEAEDKYKEKNVCDEIHRSVNEKLACLPDVKKSLTQIETKIDILLNGK